MILIDTNVLIHILARNDIWYDWPKARLTELKADRLHINDIVYAELAPYYSSEKALDDAIAELELILERIPKLALFNAGRVFRDYRRSGGTRTSILSDFFIGAHADVTGLTILTRDVRRYRTYFPNVALIAPDLT